MNDPVLTDEEKGALLNGVEKGEVEVLSDSGPKYAKVAAFEVAARNRLVTNSYPRLQNIDHQLAGVISKSLSVLLNDKVEVAAGPLAYCTWGEFREQEAEVALIFEFGAQPLDGSAFIVVPSGAVRNTVETFYGGSKDNPPVHEIDGFTHGEVNVVALFCADILRGITQTWQSVIALDARQTALHQSTDVVEAAENGAFVLCTKFVLHVRDDHQHFYIVWPTSTLAGLLPVLEGAKRERNPKDDARWEQVIRSRISAAPIDINSRIGHARMSLREVAALEPGDVIELEDPRSGTVFARNVAVLEGRFGVNEGRFAIEATRWLANVDVSKPVSNQS